MRFLLNMHGVFVVRRKEITLLRDLAELSLMELSINGLNNLVLFKCSRNIKMESVHGEKTKRASSFIIQVITVPSLE